MLREFARGERQVLEDIAYSLEWFEDFYKAQNPQPDEDPDSD